MAWNKPVPTEFVGWNHGPIDTSWAALEKRIAALEERIAKVERWSRGFDYSRLGELAEGVYEEGDV